MVCRNGLIVLVLTLIIVPGGVFSFTKAIKPTVQATSNQIINSFLEGSLKPSRLSPREIVKRADSIDAFRDLLIILDSSRSQGKRNFEIVKHQIGELLSLVCPIPDPFNSESHYGYHQVALIQFSSFVIEEFDFDDNRNIAEIKAAIKSVPYLGGMRCTGDALYKAIQMFNSSKGMRTGTKHEVLILTDGTANCGKPLSTVLPALQAKATVFALAIGSLSASANTQLKSYVSKPTPDHLFAIDNFGQLEKLIHFLKAHINISPCIPFDLSKK